MSFLLGLRAGIVRRYTVTGTLSVTQVSSTDPVSEAFRNLRNATEGK
jgi:hypothetical protein